MAKNTIKIKNYSDITEEFIAMEAITPGMLVEIHTDGKLKKHATANGNVLTMFACEDELQGKGINDAFASGDPVQTWVTQRGDMVNAILSDGQNAVIGSWLVSAGDGRLNVYTAAASGAVIEATIPIVGQAVNAVNMSGSSAVDPDGRILVRIY